MKRRFIQMREPPYDFIEVSEDYAPEPKRHDGLLYNDRGYDGLRATDGTPIDSRTKHREYMKRNDLATADDFKETWAKAREKRDDYFQGKGGGAVKKDDIARAIHQLQELSSRRR